MNSAFQWVDDLLRWFAKWLPTFRIVTGDHGGVKWKRGKHAVLVKPGLCWFWPAVSVVELYPVVRQTVNLPTQCLLTANNHEVVVGGIVVYDVADVLRLLTTTHEPDDAVRDLALVAIKLVVTTRTLDELRTEQGAIDDALTKELRQKLARPFGVRVLSCYLSDFATCHVLKLVGLQPKE